MTTKNYVFKVCDGIEEVYDKAMFDMCLEAEDVKNLSEDVLFKLFKQTTVYQDKKLVKRYNKTENLLRHKKYRVRKKRDSIINKYAKLYYK